MYFEMCLNSEYEMLVTEEEITTHEDVKPRVVSPPIAPSIFDACYDPATTEIKKEPEDLPAKGLTSRSIGELIITQPDFIVRSIKQEILDTTATAMEISAKHSPSCELNCFVDTHGGISGLQIEDICSLVLADQSVFPERVPIEPGSSSLTTLPSTGSTLHVVSASMQPSTPQQAGTAMPTMAMISSLHVVTSDNVITNTPLPPVTVSTATTSEQINLSSNIHTPLPIQATTQSHKLTPLPMVTDCPAAQVTCHQNTPSSSHTPLPMVSLAANVFPSPLPMATTLTAPLDNIVSTPSCTLKWSRVHNKLVKVDPNTLLTTMIAETSTDNSSIIQKPITDSGKHSTSSKKYYEVLTPQQDDIIFISHVDVIYSKCSVKLNRISDAQIAELCEHKNDTQSPSTSSDLTESPAVKRKTFYRPKHKPSRARVRAQKIITECKKTKL